MSTLQATAGQIRGAVDRRLGSVTMYRLVTLVLLALAVVSIAYSAFGGLGEGLFTVGGQLLSLVVVVAVTLAFGWMFARSFRAQPHLESSVITALLLWFLFVPQTDPIKLGWIALAGAIASGSKYVLAWRGRHLFNPAAAGALGTYLVQSAFSIDPDQRLGASWWVASADLLPWVAVGAVLVLWRTRRLDLGVIFVLVAGVLVVLGYQSFGQGWGPSVQQALETSPLVFFAGFMLSEPLTLPPRQHQQRLIAVVAAVVYAYPLAVLTIDQTPPLFGIGDQWQVTALLVANLVAFAFARRSAVSLELVEHREVAGDVHELTFRPAEPVRFAPGQYAELHLPHGGADSRGVRRMFSISSAPSADTVSFALRVPAPGSSFKQALVGLTPGATVRSTGVAGDFLLPRDPSVPVVLVAGGIGITPFLSQLHEDVARGVERDVVVVYGVLSEDEVPFADRLAGVRTEVVAGPLSADAVAALVPDLARRHAYVSGPPAMVDALRPGLRKRAKKVKVDHFSGY